MSTSRALRIFRYFVHPGLSSIPLFLGPTGATAKGSHFARANYASGALSPSPFRLAQHFCRPAVTNGRRHRLILDQQNDMVRRIPYSRLTSLFFNERTFHRRQNSSRRRGTFGRESGPGLSDGAGSASYPKPVGRPRVIATARE